MSSEAFFLDLVYPDPVDLAPLISWERAIIRLAEEPKRVLDRCTQYVRSAQQHPNEQVKEFASSFSAGSSEQRARIICLGAVLEGALVVLVKRVESAEAYELKRLVWLGEALFLSHPLSLVRTGFFAPAVAQLPSASVSLRLSGDALYVPEGQMTRIVINHQRAGDGELARAMTLIIKEHEATGKKIRNADFMSRMKKETGASPRHIQSFWPQVPDHLKHSHRPRTR